MFFLAGLRQNFKQITLNIAWIFIIGYFIYHILSGARGFISWNHLNNELDVLSNELQRLQYENGILENKVSRMRDDNLDLDLLEEQAENILGFFKKDSIIVLLPRYK